MLFVISDRWTHYKTQKLTTVECYFYLVKVQTSTLKPQTQRLKPFWRRFLSFVRRLIACYCRRHYIWFYLLGVFLIIFASLQIMFSYVFQLCFLAQSQCSISILLENIRKPEVFCCFQRQYEQSIGLSERCLLRFSCLIS